MKQVSTAVFIIAIMVVLVLGGCAQSTPAPAPGPKTLTIGSIWGLTGPGSEIMTMMSMSETMCKDWINKKGGIDIQGQKYLIDIITEDNKNAADGCITSAQKLVFQHKVKFVIGTVVPFQSETIRTITDPNKVFFMASVYDVPSPDFPYTFGAYFPYGDAKPVEYDYLVKAYPNVKRVYVVHEDEAANNRAADRAVVEIQKRGLELVANESYIWGTSDFYSLLTKVIATKPDAIDRNMGFPDNGATFVKQARELGFTGPILANSPWDPNLLLQMIGPEAATDFFLPTVDPTSPSVQVPPLLTEIMKLWDETYHVPFVLDACRGWDPLYVTVQAIEKAQSFDPEEVAKVFQTMGTVDTSVGPAPIGGLKSYGINAVLAENVPLSRLQNGEIEFIGWFPLNIP